MKRFNLIHFFIFLVVIFTVFYAIDKDFLELSPPTILACGSFATGEFGIPPSKATSTVEYLTVTDPSYTPSLALFDPETRALVNNLVGGYGDAEKDAKSLCEGALIANNARSRPGGHKPDAFFDSFGCNPVDQCISGGGTGCGKYDAVHDNSKSNIKYDCKEVGSQDIFLATSGGSRARISATRHTVSCSCETAGGAVTLKSGCFDCEYRA